MYAKTLRLFSGSPVAGALLSKDFHLWRPTLFAAVCTFVAALCFGISRVILGRRKKTWKV